MVSPTEGAVMGELTQEQAEMTIRVAALVQEHAYHGVVRELAELMIAHAAVIETWSKSPKMAPPLEALGRALREKADHIQLIEEAIER